MVEPERDGAAGATLVLAVTPYVSRIVRGSMLEVLDREYVELARLKGLPRRW